MNLPHVDYRRPAKHHNISSKKGAENILAVLSALLFPQDDHILSWAELEKKMSQVLPFTIDRHLNGPYGVIKISIHGQTYQWFFQNGHYHLEKMNLEQIKINLYDRWLWRYKMKKLYRPVESWVHNASFFSYSMLAAMMGQDVSGILLKHKDLRYKYFENVGR